MINWAKKGDRWVEAKPPHGYRYEVKRIGTRWCAVVGTWAPGSMSLPRTLACYPTPAEARKACEQHLEARHAPQ